MDDNIYTGIGYIVVLGIRLIIVPIGVGVSIAVIAHKILQPQPKGRKKDG